MHAQFGDYREINEVAFAAQGRTWVFVAHPSPANGEFKQWLTGDPSSASGRKQRLAVQALGTATPSQEVPLASPQEVGGLASSEARPSSSLTPRRPMQPRKPEEDRFAQSFHLVRTDGRKIVPVRMKNMDTGHVAFRVAKMGNTKGCHIEVDDELDLARYCESGQYMVRAQPLDKSTPANLVRPLLNHRIVKGSAR